MSALVRYPAVNTASGWAALIAECWRANVENIFEVGRLLVAAKDAIDHGEWKLMVERDLPFKVRTAQRLMEIARDERLQEATRVSLLPNDWGTIYEISRMDDAQLERAFEEKVIRPDSERSEITQRIKAARRTERERKLGEKIVAYPTKQFGLIVADDEWDHQVYSRVTGLDRHASNHYETAAEAHSAEEMHARTKNRFDCAAPNCLLAMWATVQHLDVAIDLLRLRGFKYVSHYVWGKDKIGLGYWNRNKHEILLLGVRGNIPCPAQGAQWESLIMAPRRAHSAKPECFLEMLEQYFPTLPKIELNRRGPKRPGWEAWGNETEESFDTETGEILDNTQSPVVTAAATTEPEPASTMPMSSSEGEAVGAGSSACEDLDIPSFLRRESDEARP